MITQADLDELLNRNPVPDSPVLSVYLDIDQGKAANLRRRFEASLKDRLREIGAGLDKDRAQTFSADAERVLRLVAGLEPKGKGLVVFCDDSENFSWERRLQVPIRSSAHWTDRPYLLRLIRLMDEYERYGVVLVDKAHARLFTVFMGEIEEQQEALAPAEVKHIHITGTDRILSQKRFQSRSDTHAQWHLRRVAETAARIADRSNLIDWCWLGWSKLWANCTTCCPSASGRG
jgi:hypothetical protein